MHGKGWVITGMILFAALATFPFYWYAIGHDKPFPQLEKPKKSKNCVESTTFMRANHMRLLDAWRVSVVRDHMLMYTNASGKTFEMNLHKTCLGCHTSTETFCDRCHAYNDVTPPCWACHVATDVALKGGPS